MSCSSENVRLGVTAVLAVAGAVHAQTGVVGGDSPGVDVGSRRTPFTVVGLPDTQRYSESYPDIFYAQTGWVAAHRRQQNIRFVSHYGDLVQHGDRLNEWQVADDAMGVLDRAHVRYGVVAGNHDVTQSGSQGEPYIPQNYLNYFGSQRFAGKDWFLGASPSGMSSAQVFSGGGREFLALHLDVETPISELVWAQEVINAHRDKAVMVTTHRYLQDAEDYTGGVPLVDSGRYPDIWYTVEDTYTPNGIHAEEFFQNFVRTNDQIFLVNCGRFHEEYRQTSTNLRGDAVHEVLADWQDDPNGGNGYLRLMQFDVGSNRIDVKSYSPVFDDYLTEDESQFSLGVDFNRYRHTTPRLSFQNGISGYGGTQDTWISEENRGTSYGSSGTIVVDDDVNNSLFSDRRGQGLIRFDGIISDVADPSKIPLGSVVTEATLRIGFEDDIDSPIFDADIDVYMLTTDWNESSTWDSLGDGLQAGVDYGAFLGTLDGDNEPDSDYWRVLDVTAAVQAWVSGAANYGVALLPEIISGNDDGVTIWSSEFGNPLLRPALEVSFVPPGFVPAPPVFVVVLGGGWSVLGRRKQR